MKILWCWRCKQEVPMLDDEEYRKAYELMGEGMKASGGTMEERFKKLTDFHEELTGIRITNPNVIMHHRISSYGPPCENCGKPYRTPFASFCPACGNKRQLIDVEQGG